MEPERKIEKLLRAYAKKRRADAGDFKLHPATRRLLQGEVTRNAIEPDGGDSLSLWRLLREQWAFLAGFALMIFFCATLFIPALSSAKKKAQSINAANSLRQIGLAVQIAAGENNGRLPATLDALTNELGSEKILIDPQSGQPFVYAAGREKLDDLQTNAILAYSPADKDRRDVLFADGRVGIVSREEFSELTNQKSPQLAAISRNQPQLSGDIAGAGLPHNLSASKSLLSPSETFAGKIGEGSASDRNESRETISAPGTIPAPASEPLPTQELFYRNAIPANFQTDYGVMGKFQMQQNTAVPFVLEKFQVQQYGNNLRIVDSDGSVYAGSVLTPNLNQNATTGNVTSAGSTFHERAQNFSFRVTGMNRTLQQQVIFSGDFATVSNALAAQQNSGMNATVSSQQQLSLANSRVTGTAVVGETNQIEINATPVAR